MVSADNLNLDVLELIFAYLSGNDLVSVSLVSKSFLAGVIPRLYQTLGFRMNQAKKYPKTWSPFAAIVAHPHLAVHVHTIDIRAVPISGSQYHSQFIRDATSALILSQNLSSFTLTVDTLPSFLISLQNKPRLEELRVHANLNRCQMELLTQIKGLRSLDLDYASWNVVDGLSGWCQNNLSATLTTLTLYMAHDLNDQVLASTLENLPNLTSLHVVGCPKADHVTVLQLAGLYTPHLESLSLTTWESPRTLPPLPPLLHLTRLSIDTHCTLSPPSIPPLYTALFALFSPSPLSHLTLKLSDKLILADSFIDGLVERHGMRLKTLSLVGCVVGTESVMRIMRGCRGLDVLGITVPVKEMFPFTLALSHSKSVHTLIDMGEKHENHGPRLSLSKDSIRTLMESVKSLRVVVCDNRRWVATRERSKLKISLERRKRHAAQHWFMAP
ncbi:hypothetical protein JAAARDRAFT_179330 [Jaapia argillacea MUCL 33604]|uniref:F-box domain-containing protein n=1 Tax=Jaapia argillacea MUCL 33604 TaxID=933084 RepID=A0A067PZL4_9AGAM|nr:hypothetical protein JAAARDRAFT_179330 [Jaapia argillacea MUCL 33604]